MFRIILFGNPKIVTATIRSELKYNSHFFQPGEMALPFFSPLVENFVHTAHLHGVARVISLTNLIYLYPLEELQTALLEVGHHCLLIVLLGGVDPDDLILQLDLDV